MSYLKEHDEHRKIDGGYRGTVIYIQGTLGEIEYHECDTCGYADILCIHEKNTWNDKGTVLTCNLCGIEGT